MLVVVPPGRPGREPRATAETTSTFPQPILGYTFTNCRIASCLSGNGSEGGLDPLDGALPHVDR